MKNIIKRNILIFAVVVFAGVLTTCENLNGNEGTLTISFINNSRSIGIPDWPPTDFPGMLEQIIFEITLTDNSGTLPVIEAKAGDTIKTIVTTGRWTVTIRAFYPEKPMLYAIGTDSVDVIANKNNSVFVQMKKAFGSGTAEDPWLIYNADQLYEIAQQINGDIVGTEYRDKYYKLVADIDLSAYADGEGWTPIGNDTNGFTGTFDGNGKIISNLTINRSVNQQGLFGVIESGTVKNVGVVDAEITGNQQVGGIAGRNNGIINGCFFSGTVTGNNYVGGITGIINNGTISNCYNTGNVTNNFSNTGGIVGWMVVDTDSAVINCYNTGSIQGQNTKGGIVGHGTNNLIANCVMLGLSISSGGTNRHRIVGTRDDASLFFNFYARSDTNVDPYLILDCHGVDITPAEYNSEGWWKDPANWNATPPATAWDFVNVWEWNSSTRLPILRGFAPGTQEHTAPLP